MSEEDNTKAPSKSGLSHSVSATGLDTTDEERKILQELSAKHFPEINKKDLLKYFLFLNIVIKLPSRMLREC